MLELPERCIGLASLIAVDMGEGSSIIVGCPPLGT
jgi:hypothetical protein